MPRATFCPHCRKPLDEAQLTQQRHVLTVVFPGMTWDQFLASSQRDFLQMALDAHDGNVYATARSLGTSRARIMYAAEKHGITLRTRPPKLVVDQW